LRLTLFIIRKLVTKSGAEAPLFSYRHYSTSNKVISETIYLSRMNNYSSTTDWIPILFLAASVGLACLFLWTFRSYIIKVPQLLSPSLGPSDPSPSYSDSDSSLSGGQWCFVGSDMTGRWCVKTPEDNLCPSDRVFRSRSECEMKTGSALPLGINQNHDTTMIPIAGLAIA